MRNTLITVLVLAALVGGLLLLRTSGDMREAERSRLAGIEDYERLLEGKAPVRSSGPVLLKDGGSERWEGSCYTVTRLNRLHSDEQGRTGRMLGVELLFACRDKLDRFENIVREDRSSVQFVVDPSPNGH